MTALIAAAGVMHGERVATQSGAREIYLPLDGLIGITVSYGRRRITIPVDAILSALEGK